MFEPRFRIAIAIGSLLAAGSAGVMAQDEPKTEEEKPAAAPAAGSENAKKPLPPLPGPPPIPKVALGPVLPTHAIRRGVQEPNLQMIDASVLPLDRKGIWVLDFAYKPVRMRTVDIPGKGRRQIHYLYYRVINRTGEPRTFVPQFTLVTDTGKRYEDTPSLPNAVNAVQMRESPGIELVNGPTAMGTVPPSGKKVGVDDAVFGVAVWEGVDPHADAFSIYVRGLSDGYQLVKPPGENEPVRKDKTLRIDFARPGDDRHLHEREIRPLDPPYDWIYW